MSVCLGLVSQLMSLSLALPGCNGHDHSIAFRALGLELAQVHALGQHGMSGVFQIGEPILSGLVGIAVHGPCRHSILAGVDQVMGEIVHCAAPEMEFVKTSVLLPDLVGQGDAGADFVEKRWRKLDDGPVAVGVVFRV